MGKTRLQKAPSSGVYKAPPALSSSMISIWDSGIEYGAYSYDTSVYNNSFGFDADTANTRAGATTTTGPEEVKVVPTERQDQPQFPQMQSPPMSKQPKWSEFTKSTTFHGVRYVFDDGPFAIRRVLWILCVLSAIILFSFQVIDRARAYFEYDTNTNVEVVYVDKVEFPSVTFCNQNNYRITEAVAMGLFDYIDRTYSYENTSANHNSTSRTQQDPDVSHVNLTEFVLTVAHQKEDFIDSCTWKGEGCNIRESFQTTMTDFGVCYTFNSHENLTLSHTGSGFALSLVLNIEQYQYMKGPQDEAGIKVLLHDHREVPLVKDLGFAIAPGTHTLIAVQRQVVNALNEPYGTCVLGSIPRSDCLSECRTKYVVGKCGCRDVSMPDIQYSPVCDMEKALTCVRKTIESFTREDRSCRCDIPCNRITYQPELSYAHLSKLNVDRISLNDEGKREKVQQTFEHAREVAQRVNEVIANKDAELVAKVLNASAGYAHDLEHSLKVLTDTAYVTRELSVLAVFEEPFPVFKQDFAVLDQVYVTKSAIMSQSFPQYSFYDKIEYEFNRVVEMRGTNSIFQMAISDCARQEQEQEGGGTGGSQGGTMNYYDCDDGNSYTYLYYKKNRIQNILNYLKSCHQSVDGVSDGYKALMDYLYAGTLINHHLKAEYHLCLDTLRKVRTKWLPILTLMGRTCQAYLNATTWTEKLVYVNEMIKYENWTSNDESSLNKQDYRNCNWYRLPGSVSLEDRSHALFLAHSDSAETSYIDAKGIILQLANMGKENANGFNRTLQQYFSYFQRFYIGNMTKTELYSHMTSHDFKVGMEELRLSNERYLTDYRQFLSKVSDVENNLLLSLDYSFSFKVPVMNDTVISHMKFIKYAEKHQNLSADIQRHLGSVREKKPESLQGLTDALYGSYRRMIQDVHSKILQSFQEMTVSLHLLENDLGDFVKGNQMGEDFFMDNFIKIDIFYKELSYEQIKQQVAFELLSLVSEIGGFLGLLLGASILTVCELVDFLVLAGIRKCESRNFTKGRDFLLKEQA